MQTKNLSAARNPATGKLQWDIKAGDILSIEGTGFGAKSQPAYYDNFSKANIGAISGGVGSLIWSNANGSSIAAEGRSSENVIKHNYAVNDFPKVYKNLSGSNDRLYMSCYLKFSGASTGVSVFKHGRVGSYAGVTPDVYSGSPHAGASYTSAAGIAYPTDVGGEIVVGADKTLSGWSANMSGTDTTPALAYTQNVWHYYEVEFYAGTVDGNNSFFSERVDGKIVTQWVNRPYLIAGHAPSMDWVLTPLNGLDGTPAITYWIGNMYITESRNRIVMTDNASYVASTKWELQPDLEGGWSNTKIYYKPVRGSFTQGSTAYLHIFNNGVLVSTKTITVP